MREEDHAGARGIELTTQHAVTLLLMALASFLLAILALREGNVWGVIGLVVVPLCLVALIALVVVELRREQR